VEVDNQGGIAALMTHLYNLGHRRIAYIGGPQQLKIQRDRYFGYEQSLLSCGIPFDPQLVATSNLTQSGGYNTARQILALDRPPTAIICISDVTAIGVLHAAHDLGLQVGQDLAVAGFDGIEQAEHTHPPLTTLDQPVYTIARNLVAMLVKLIGGQVLEQRLVKIEPELIIRASTEGRAFSHPPT
jgi:DNA-binding LacI/PurR family transcriptional regulator